MTAAPKSAPSPSRFAGADHDHAGCVAAALAAAESICRKNGTRLTRLRRRVLELVWQSHRPVGAYALLDMLREEGRAAPPTVYRALDFLQAHGLVHRLASLNAYVGCSRPGTLHTGQFLICGACHNLVEMDEAGVAAAIERSARAAGFQVQQQTVEIQGLCPDCR
ncbi:transcriptional repressor [uncultured Desulfuromonas sp.]|uniref:transcriptional repressor n=1 Tax=uncultured Desulfuromonas sp. TaxID=181013 RepID=UPI00260F5C8E|nr:transcriptional repressor [uncultured Desulfuromonas sp.]